MVVFHSQGFELICNITPCLNLLKRKFGMCMQMPAVSDYILVVFTGKPLDQFFHTGCDFQRQNSGKLSKDFVEFILNLKNLSRCGKYG